MAPKPRPIPRKPSISKGPNVKIEQDKSMPPPPAPPAPGILVPEVMGLSTCLKNAVVKTGQLYAFYADTRKLGIQNYAPAPPQSLTSALGRELEKYDQLCDSIESQLLRAISVLQRDLAREERRIKDAEAEAEAKANSVAGRTRSASRSPTSMRIPLPGIDLSATSGDGSRPSTADPTLSPPLSNSSIVGRRPSAISISSLHRPNLPLKLDLSSSALRITPEEASLFSQGLSSPLPPEIMAALASASSDTQSRPVDIDLTSPDHATAPDVEMTGIGSSADKPIELDLDAMEIDMAAMSDLFGDADANSNNSGANSNAGEGLFTPGGVKEENDEESFLSALSGAAGGGDDMFASLRGNAGPSNQSVASGSASAQQMSAPSPGSLLASFSHQMGGTAQAYDLDALDLTNLGAGFFGDDTQNAETDMNMVFDMEELLNMGGGGGSGGDHTGAGTAAASGTGTEPTMDPRVKTEHYVPAFGV
ncbi:hypothetical protein B0H14DRAFT_3091417 [Mycena olivaceomarginata]|nr:hypothetical protein B0H14DRAFT_3091417 [Mycena olivaceomarginata]